MSDSLHLERRNGVFYYRRRVPDEAVAAIGKRIIKYSLQTSIKSEARKRREIEDLKWSAHFDSALTESKTVAASSSPSPNASSHETVNLLREYVERVDAKMARAWATDAPSMSRNDVLDVCSEADEDIALLRNASYPPTAERVTRVVHKVLAEGSVEKALSADRQTEELARRALLELARRRLARLEDDHSRPFFDHLFGPSAARQVTFGELCVQYLEEARRDAEINGFSGKRVDKVEDNVALVREIIGENTLTSSVDYDACLRARVLLAETPTNRTKLYPKLTLPEAIERAKLDGKPVLSATTQSQYLETLKGILELATLKTLIPQNPARTLRPLKRDQTSASAKRLPFSLE